MSEEAVSLTDALAQQYDAQLENDPKREVPEAGDIQPEAEPQIEALTAPEHWPKDRQEAFSSVPRNIQDIWLAREKEVDQGFKSRGDELRDVKSRLDQYETVVGPLRQSLQLQGMNEHQWLGQMAAYTTALQNDPAGVIRAVANQYGVDLTSLGGGSDEFVDPQIKALTDQITELKQQLSQTVQTQTQSVQQQHVQAIEAFRDQKDTEGNLLHPHFDALTQDITVLAQGYRASGQQPPPLAELYTAALRMHPELTEAERQAAAEAAEAARKQQALESAKRARSASTRPRDTAADAGAMKPASLREQLAQHYDAQSG